MQQLSCYKAVHTLHFPFHSLLLPHEWCDANPEGQSLHPPHMNGPWCAETAPAGQVPLKLMLSDNMNQFSVPLSHFRPAGLLVVQYWKCVVHCLSWSQGFIVGTLRKEYGSEQGGRHGRQSQHSTVFCFTAATLTLPEHSLLCDKLFPSSYVRTSSLSSLTQRLRAILTNSHPNWVQYYGEMKYWPTKYPVQAGLLGFLH